MDQNSAAADVPAGAAPAAAAAPASAAPAPDASTPAARSTAETGGTLRRARRAPLIALGATCGIAWTAGFRAYMVELAGTESTVDWAGTFGAILLPGAIVGGLLGWAESLRRTDGDSRRRWLALAPLALAVAPLLRPGAVVELVTTGEGGAAVGVVLLGIGGGYAISGEGKLWGRLLAGILSGAALVAVALMPAMIGGARLAVSSPRGAWVSVLAGSLLVLLVLASSIPFRRPAGHPAGHPGDHPGDAAK